MSRFFKEKEIKKVLKHQKFKILIDDPYKNMTFDTYLNNVKVLAMKPIKEAYEKIMRMYETF